VEPATRSKAPKAPKAPKPTVRSSGYEEIQKPKIKKK